MAGPHKKFERKTFMGETVPKQLWPHIKKIKTLVKRPYIDQKSGKVIYAPDFFLKCASSACKRLLGYKAWLKNSSGKCVSCKSATNPSSAVVDRLTKSQQKQVFFRFYPSGNGQRYRRAYAKCAGKGCSNQFTIHSARKFPADLPLLCETCSKRRRSVAERDIANWDIRGDACRVSMTCPVVGCTNRTAYYKNIPLEQHRCGKHSRLQRLGAFEKLHRVMQESATNRNLSCRLSIGRFSQLLAIGQCFYCRGPFTTKTGIVVTLKSMAFTAKKDGYIAGGGYFIDRMDAQSGYSSKNCVPCCADCNWVKGDRLTVREAAIFGALKAGRTTMALTYAKLNDRQAVDVARIFVQKRLADARQQLHQLANSQPVKVKILLRAVQRQHEKLRMADDLVAETPEREMNRGQRLQLW